MTATRQIVNHVLEADEPEEFITTRRKLRPATAARMQARYASFLGRSSFKPSEDSGEDVGFNSGGRSYERVNGEWYKERRSRNPAHSALPRYFVIAGTFPIRGWVTVYCRRPGRIAVARWRSAVKAIARDFNGGTPVPWEDFITEWLDQSEFDRALNGKKQAPVYDVFVDGTWKRLR